MVISIFNFTSCYLNMPILRIMASFCWRYLPQNISKSAGFIYFWLLIVKDEFIEEFVSDDLKTVRNLSILYNLWDHLNSLCFFWVCLQTINIINSLEVFYISKCPPKQSIVYQLNEVKVFTPENDITTNSQYLNIKIILILNYNFR